MGERDPPRVQERPREPQASRVVPRPPVHPVAQDRVADRRQVHPDLMRAAGPRRRLQQGRGPGPLDGPRTASRRGARRSRPGSRARRACRARRPPRTPRAPRARGRAQVSPLDVVARGTSRSSASCASSVFATSISPDVPASRRCTIPGRSGPPTDESGTSMNSRRFTSVPERRRSVGCVTTPGRFRDHEQMLVLEPDRHRRALRLQRRPRPRSTTDSDSPPRSANDLLRATPSTVTWPAVIARWTSARVRPVSRASTTSRRPGSPTNASAGIARRLGIVRTWRTTTGRAPRRRPRSRRPPR